METADPVFGDLHYSDAMASNQVKGNLVVSRKRYLKAHFDDATYESVVAKLKGPAQQLLVDPPAAFAWTSMRHLMEVDRAIVQVPMHGDIGRMRAFGAEIAQYDLSSIYKLFLRVTMSPGRIMDRLPDMYGQYLTPGKMIGERLDDHNGKLTLQDTILPLYLCKYGIPGWIEAALGLGGARNINIKHPQCRHKGDEICTYEICWD